MHDIFTELLNEQLRFHSVHSWKQLEALPEMQKAKLNDVLKEPHTVGRRRLGADSEDECGGNAGWKDSRLATAALCCARHEVCLTSTVCTAWTLPRTQSKPNYNLAQHPETKGVPENGPRRICWKEARHGVCGPGPGGLQNNWILRNGTQKPKSTHLAEPLGSTKDRGLPEAPPLLPWALNSVPVPWWGQWGGVRGRGSAGGGVAARPRPRVGQKQGQKKKLLLKL